MSELISMIGLYRKLKEKSLSTICDMYDKNNNNNNVNKHNEVFEHNLHVLIDLCNEKLNVDNHVNCDVNQIRNKNNDNKANKYEKYIKRAKTTEGYRYKCVFNAECTMQFDRIGKIIEHINTHTGEKPFICDYVGCEYASNGKSNLIKHLRTHTGEKPFICDYVGCEYASIRNYDLIRHLRTHTGDKTFKCNWSGCRYRTDFKYRLIIHERTHTGEKPFKCDWSGCEYRANDNRLIIKHRRNVHAGEKPSKPVLTVNAIKHYKANRCEKYVEKVDTTDGYRYKCVFNNECDKQFNRMEAVIEHIRTHTGEKPYICRKINCDFKSAYKGSLDNHRRFVHDNHLKKSLQKKLLECDSNDTKSRYKNLITKHKRIRLKRYKCDWSGCDYTARSNNEVIEHKRKHTGEKPFKCDHVGCDYATAWKGDLSKHFRRHLRFGNRMGIRQKTGQTKRKPYKCDWNDCGYRTDSMGKLIIHKRTHTGEKPFKCDWNGCEYRANDNYLVIKHRRIHNGEEPPKCD